jgi:N-glycosylase/DNA lyase
MNHYNEDEVKKLHKEYKALKERIDSRQAVFSKFSFNPCPEKLFEELSFCLLTPQSKARSCDKAISILKESNLLALGTSQEISEKLNIVRFRNNKAGYIVRARELFREKGLDDLLNELKSPVELKDGSSGMLKAWE